MSESPPNPFAFTVKHFGFSLRFLSYVISQRPWKQIDVILTPDAQRYLDIGDADSFRVEFSLTGRQDADNQQPSENITDRPVAILRDGHQVGVLDAETSAACRPMLGAGHTMSTAAKRKRDEHGQWRLLISRPLL
jgi:hypothetical protein